MKKKPNHQRPINRSILKKVVRFESKKMFEGD